MSSQRYSCDRCRHHKVRCLKISGDSTAGVERGSGDTCERCAKAEVQCVYSSRQKKGRASSHRLRRDSTLMSLARTMPFSQDMTGAWSVGSDELGSVGEMSIPFFDTTEMNMPDLGDGDFYNWETGNPTPSSMSAVFPESGGAYDLAIQKDLGAGTSLPGKESEGSIEALIGQAMDVSTRAVRATRQLDQAVGNSPPLMVSSPEINTAFETANVLVQIVNSIPQGSDTLSSSLLPRNGNEDPQLANYGLIFLALASHQHVLTLFKSICVSIQRSVGFNPSENEQQSDPVALHGDGASCAQFVMVLQLIMHLVNRLGRSLRLDSKDSASRRASGCVSGTAELTPPVEGEEDTGASPRGFVDKAEDMLRRLPDEHIKLRQMIQQLQTHMEERLHT